LEELDKIQEQDDVVIQKKLSEAHPEMEFGRTVTLDELDKELGIAGEELGSQYLWLRDSKNFIW
jgi:hypothetical protein